MLNNFKNKTAVITGGNSGIGYAAAKEFKERGATVIITGRRKDALDKAAEELGVHSILADQGSLADIDKLMSTVKSQYKKVDFLFINAGMSGGVFPIEHGTVANFEEVMNVNVRGSYFFSEITSLIGDIATYNGIPVVHAHANFGTEDGTVRGGHLLEAFVSPTLEVMMTVEPESLYKKLAPEFGILVIDPKSSSPDSR